MKLSNSRTSFFASLHRRSCREAERLFIVSGRKCVEDTSPAFGVEALIVRSDAEAPDISAAEVFTASPAQLARISRMDSAPEVVAVCRLPVFAEDPDRVNTSLSLMLDGVQDPGNLGTIIRTAAWFGIRDIFASEDTADAFQPKAVQAAMGALAKVQVHYGPLTEVLDRYPSSPVYGTVLDGSDLYTTRLGAAGFIVMGNEGKGISDAIQKRLDRRLLIPAYPPGAVPCESLNVAAATAVILSEFRRRIME